MSESTGGKPHLCIHPLAEPLVLNEGELVLPRGHVCECELGQDHGHEKGPVARLFVEEGEESNWLN